LPAYFPLLVALPLLGLLLLVALEQELLLDFELVRRGVGEVWVS
jgi:hypothetical protein